MVTNEGHSSRRLTAANSAGNKPSPHLLWRRIGGRRVLNEAYGGEHRTATLMYHAGSRTGSQFTQAFGCPIINTYRLAQDSGCTESRAVVQCMEINLRRSTALTARPATPRGRRPLHVSTVWTMRRTDCV
ncbi:hypothetical protein EVAR_38192_1 [Eumeta japonica]|uniref:Uncharacterized protein n=1 Tax=Eumeta variegata TaxID=151549 RepID=A0A4C1WH03_EUMVA|nr:hypothetical protein EVAR_38192_1 [Eumeta japonica]